RRSTIGSTTTRTCSRCSKLRSEIGVRPELAEEGFGQSLGVGSGDPKSQGSTIGDRQRPIVHRVSENGLRMEGILEPDRFVIFVLVVAGREQVVGAIEHDKADMLIVCINVC